MCNGIVLDACSIAEYQKARIDDKKNNQSVIALETFLKDGFIVLDHDERILQEWLDTASYHSHTANNLRDWIADQAQRGRIRYQKTKADQHTQQKLRGLGMKPKDIYCLRTAHQAKCYALISEDIDFYDPACRAATTKSARRMKSNRTGKVCRYARRQLGLEIGTVSSVSSIVPPCGK